MKRRQFITLFGGAAATWPLVARAQQAERMRRIGFLTGGSAPPGDALVTLEIGSLVEELRQRGWAEGRNIGIEYRFSDGPSM
jgi:putative ABC transport system substrate-binding protein